MSINTQKSQTKKGADLGSLSFKTGGIAASMMIIMAGSAFAQNSNTKATPNQMVDALHSAFGKHPNARAVHAKGLIMEGDFEPASGAAMISKAPHFNGKRIPATFRFSDFTGIPDIPDTIGAANPRGLAIKFHLPDGGSTDIVAHSFDGFPVSTTDDFRDFLLAISKSGPEASHPSPIESFLGTHPIAKTFVTTQKAPSVSYGTLAYFGVNAFKFTNKKGVSQFIRYQFIPESGEQFLTPGQLQESGPDYLSKEIAQRLAKGPVKFKMYAQIAEAGDKTGDPGIAWPRSRKLILLGVLTIQKLTKNTVTEDKAMIFNPGNIPSGIELADQMLIDRQKAYPISVAERQQ